MAIQFACPECRRTLQVDDRCAGAKIRCPKCRAITTAPAAATPNRPAPARASAKAGPAKAPKATRPAPQNVDDDDEPIRFSNPREDEGLDMTSMLDCVFLLLIFFMVTSAYNLQKSLEIPKPSQDNAIKEKLVMEPEEGNLVVEVHGDDTIWINEAEAPSEQDLLVKLREAQAGVAGTDSMPINSVLVMADREASHEMVVRALDACNAVNMEKIKLATVSEEDF